MAGRRLDEPVIARADEFPVTPGFKRYRSHKIVEAGKMVAIQDMQDDGSGIVVIKGSDGIWHQIPVPAGFRRPGALGPYDGDYLVRYEDGYLSWSPKDKFEAGYTET